jgi:hypothetical protein
MEEGVAEDFELMKVDYEYVVLCEHINEIL